MSRKEEQVLNRGIGGAEHYWSAVPGTLRRNCMDIARTRTLSITGVVVKRRGGHGIHQVAVWR